MPILISHNVNPPSLLYPPDGIATWFARLGLPGVTQVFGINGKPLALIDFRGWLRHVGASCEKRDPDWHYSIEVDLDSLDEIGLGADHLMRPGDMINLGYAASVQGEVTDRSSARAIYMTPLIHMELDAWPRTDAIRGRPAKPVSWTFTNACGQGAPVWPYDPQNPKPGDPPLAVGQYVRVVGSLVTDQPHLLGAEFPTSYVLEFGFAAARSTLGEQLAAEGEGNAVKRLWGGTNASDPEHPARWNEIHSPDYIEVLPAKEPTDTVRCVALVAQMGSVTLPTVIERLTADIRPPQPRPTRWHRLHLDKRVGAATLAASILTDEFLPLTRPDRARVRVRVQAQGTSHGRFFAVYRVGWRGIVPHLRAAVAGAGGGALLAVDANGRTHLRPLVAQHPHWPSAWSGLRQGRAQPGAPLTLVSRAPAHLDAFVVGTDGTVYTAATAGRAWGGWWPVAGVVVPQGAAVNAISRSRDKLDLFVSDSGGRVMTSSWQAGAAAWSGWSHILGGLSAPGAAVSAVVRRADFMDIFCVGTDGGVYTAAWEPGAAGWRGWWRVGSVVLPLGAPITAISAEPDRIDLYAVDISGRIVTAFWKPAVSTWQGWTQVQGGTAAPRSRVAAASRRRGQIDIFIVGTDGLVITAAADLVAGSVGGWWPLGGITSRPGTPVEAVSPEADSLVVATSANHGGLLACSWTPASGWRPWASID